MHCSVQLDLAWVHGRLLLWYVAYFTATAHLRKQQLSCPRIITIACHSSWWWHLLYVKVGLWLQVLGDWELRWLALRGLIKVELYVSLLVCLSPDQMLLICWHLANLLQALLTLMMLRRLFWSGHFFVLKIRLITSSKMQYLVTNSIVCHS